jgi:hypothetical protein
MCAKAYQTDTIPHTHVDTYRVYLHAIAASHTQYTPSVNNVKDDTTTKRQQHTNNPPTQTSSGVNGKTQSSSPMFLNMEQKSYFLFISSQ